MSNMQIAYSANDMYYENANYCVKDAKTGKVTNKSGGLTTECADNQSAFDNLVKMTDSKSKSEEKFNNIKGLYNREIIYAFNLIIGICALLYYIYVNQDALPTAESISNAVSSAATNVIATTKEAMPAAVPVSK